MSEVENAQTGAAVAPAENTATPQEQTHGNASASTTEVTDEQQRNEQPRDEKGRYVPQERVNEITRQKHDALRGWESERRLREQAEQRAADLERRLQPQRQGNDIPEFDFSDPAGWAARVAETAAARATQEAEQRLRAQQEQFERQQTFAKYGEREAKYKAEHADFDEVVGNLQGIRLQPEVVSALAESEYGPAVLHHLATHLDEADRIARLPAHLAAVQLGRIEAQVSAPKPKPVTQAPTPAATVGSGSVVLKDPDRMTPEEWVAWRRSQLT